MKHFFIRSDFCVLVKSHNNQVMFQAVSRLFCWENQGSSEVANLLRPIDQSTPIEADEIIHYSLSTEEIAMIEKDYDSNSEEFLVVADLLKKPRQLKELPSCNDEPEPPLKRGATDDDGDAEVVEINPLDDEQVPEAKSTDKALADFDAIVRRAAQRAASSVQKTIRIDTPPQTLKLRGSKRKSRTAPLLHSPLTSSSSYRTIKPEAPVTSDTPRTRRSSSGG